jgi:uncharacterized membrane protein YiaA
MNIQDSMVKTSFFLGTLPFSPYASLAMWWHKITPQKYKKNELQ